MINLDNLAVDMPKYIAMVGQEQDIVNNHQEARISIYESLIAGSIALRANNAEYEKVIPTIKAIIEWLRTNDFYTGPASTKYHESFHGGLLLHSLKVYNKMIELHALKSFQKVAIASATLVALTHDWCKIGKYESYIKNEKNPKTQLWEEKLAYKCSDKYLGLGHGPQSLMMLSQFCTTPLTNLSFDEMAAIRWHMYTYDVTSYDINDLNRCGNKIPLVILTQFADQLAAGDY
jgi:hypothetical protein